MSSRTSTALHVKYVQMYLFVCTYVVIVRSRYYYCIFSNGIPFRKDTLSETRAIGEAENADESNFLHPVIYYYKDIHNLSESMR